jgi:hypothetical protein
MVDLSAISMAAPQWMQAWVDPDVERLDGFLAPEYALVGAAFPG